MMELAWNEYKCRLCGDAVRCDAPEPRSPMGWYENDDESLAFWTPTRCVVALCARDAATRERIIPTVCRENPELSGLQVGSRVGIRHQPGVWTVVSMKTEPIHDTGAVRIVGATISRSWAVDGVVRTAVLDPDVSVLEVVTNQ